MNFFSKRKEDNTHLQIAWNAATVGLNPTRIRKGLLKRNTIMLYDIAKSCKLIDMSEREFMSLKMQAQLLCGVTKIMRRKTSFLYEDTLHLCSRLQSAMAVSPARTDHIDASKVTPSAFSYHAITMRDTDDLLMYQNSNHDAPFTDLFDFSHVGGPDFFDKKLYEQDFDSVLHLTNTMSIDIPYMETEYSKMVLTNSVEPEALYNDVNSATMYHDKELFDDITLDYGDNDIDFDNYDDGVDFDGELAREAEQQGDAELFPNAASEDIFEFPTPLHAENISERSSAASSPRIRPLPRITVNGPGRSYGSVRHPLPSLIAEEDENDTSFSSIDTDIYSNIVEDTDEIVVSPIPPELHRPRIVRRMMLEREQDTVLPWSMYTNTDRITRNHSIKQDTQREISKRRKLIQNELRFPSIALLPKELDTEDSVFSVMSNEKYRFYFPRQYIGRTNTTPEIYRNQQIEQSRRDHRQYSSSGSNSGSAVHIRSSSDITGSVDMHNLDLSDIDMRDAENKPHAEPSFASGYADGQFYYDDDDIDYGHFDFDDGFENALNSTMMNSSMRREQDEERRRNQFLEELQIFSQQQQNNKVYLQDFIQTKDRFETAKCFYYLLELASNNMVCPIQNEPFGMIEVQFV